MGEKNAKCLNKAGIGAQESSFNGWMMNEWVMDGWMDDDGLLWTRWYINWCSYESVYLCAKFQLLPGRLYAEI